MGLFDFWKRSEEVRLELEPGWALARHQQFRRAVTIWQYVRDGDTLEDWSQLLTVLRLRKRSIPFRGLDDAFNDRKATTEAACPGLSVWSVIARDQTSILYEWQCKPCWLLNDATRDQHELGRILVTKQNVFELLYKVKSYQMPSHRREEMITRLSLATITTAPRPPKAGAGPLLKT